MSNGLSVAVDGHMKTRRTRWSWGGAVGTAVLAVLLVSRGISACNGATRLIPVKHVMHYTDGRPALRYRVAKIHDLGVVLRYGGGPGNCDEFGARDVWVYKAGATYYMHYDGAGPEGWLCCQATSHDLLHWKKEGPILQLGKPGRADSASASYGTTYFNGRNWYMFYLGTSNATPPPDRIPSTPYVTMLAKSRWPGGPWVKQHGVVPFQPRPNTYYFATASPGPIVKRGRDYLMFFSAAAFAHGRLLRTLGLARTRNINSKWTIDRKPLFPPTEQIENASLYYQRADKTWFLFTNHVGLNGGGEYDDAIWVFWSRHLTHWNPAHGAIVLDGRTCTWSHQRIGLPSVIKVGHRLMVFYDAPRGGGTGNMRCDVGLAELRLPLVVPGRR